MLFHVVLHQGDPILVNPEMPLARREDGGISALSYPITKHYGKTNHI